MAEIILGTGLIFVIFLVVLLKTSFLGGHDYGVAIALGTLLSLVVCLWTGTENWYFWFVTVAAMQ